MNHTGALEHKHPIHEELSGYEGAKLGMWLFLATELLLFGVLFATFGILHVKFLDSFKLAHHALDKTLGGANTAVLILSSLSAALALDSIQRGRQKLCSFLLLLTILFAGGFLVIKYVEYTSKFSHHIYPGKTEKIVDPKSHSHEYITVDDYITREKIAPLEGEKLKKGVNLFFSCYFLMTGIHGLHVVIGMSILFVLMLGVRKGKYTSWSYTSIENGVIYWHLVDLIWIYLFPLLYLIR